MSTDEKITKDLIQTLKDGRDGFAKAADKLSADGRNDLAERFREFSTQRERFTTELQQLAGAVHRGWMTLKDSLAGSDPEGVLDVAEQGEDHAKSEYAKALDADISDGLRTVVQRQYTEVQRTHDIVRDLRDAYAAA